MTIDLIEFSALALAHFVALLSPGPDFILIIGNSARHGHKKTFWTCLGIAVANGAYILLAIGGFTILRESTLLFWGMKLGAAVYLIYLGSLMFKSPSRTICAETESTLIPSANEGKMFFQGFLSAILNPKNAIFYLSLMALIVSRQTPTSSQLLYGLWMFSAVLLWDIWVAWCIGNSLVRQALSSYIWRVEKSAGLLLMFAGVFIGFKS